jgi:superfamily II DNA or RNA helicase
MAVATTEQPIAFGSSTRQLLYRATAMRDRAGRVLRAPSELADQARGLSQDLRAAQALEGLRDLPLGRIRDVTQGRLRLEPLQRHGYKTVADLLAANAWDLERIHGVGPQTARQAIAAARQIAQALAEDSVVRIDPDAKDDSSTALLVAVRAYNRTASVVRPLTDPCRDFLTSVDPLLQEAELASSKLKMLFVHGERRVRVRRAVAALDELLADETTDRLAGATIDALAELGTSSFDHDRVWDDYESNAADYFSALAELGELDLEVDAAQGFVPAEIVERVERQILDVGALTVSLRGYQAFGAKFALVQRRVIIGDEMGLGKTIEAIAMMGHLNSIGSTHFVVVCPASVLINWIQEVVHRARLEPIRVHGADRTHSLRRWVERGGVAVTTYETLRGLPAPNDVSPDVLVVDEAHYVKNPATKRAEALRPWLDASNRVLFLTGTPMENRIEEFRNLVHYLSPETAATIDAADGLAGAVSFRKAVAPLYLRRNQADVLTELPQRLEAEDWLQLLDGDFEHYREAVASGNFMAMRRAAYMPADPQRSSKLARLMDIVDESALQGWKVVVFSYFRDVLAIVASMLGDIALPVLTGSVDPARRQELVDEFSGIDGPSVLVSQIQAGGVGLNMQAASVVILTEPQWKPTIEEQAIGRCHRMGQVRRVHVHRLLARDSVDERMLEILRGKRSLFDEYVVRSDLKDASASAIDVSDTDEAQRVASEAEAERLIIALEQERLGVVDDVPTRPDR